MKILKVILLVCVLGFHSCVLDESPDIQNIEKYLGIKIPSHEIQSQRADALGFEYNEEFIFKFAQSSFDSLINNVKSSTLFNYCDKNNFASLKSIDRLKAIETLKNSNLTGCWIKEAKGYEFIHPTLSMDHFDTAQIERVLNNTILDNEDLDIVDTIDLDKFPYIIYSIHMRYAIRATIDTTLNELYYHWTQL